MMQEFLVWVGWLTEDEAGKLGNCMIKALGLNADAVNEKATLNKAKPLVRDVVTEVSHNELS